MLCLRQCIDQLTAVQAELQDSVKELTKSRKKYQEAETMAQAVREKAEQDAKYEPRNGSGVAACSRAAGESRCRIFSLAELWIIFSSGLAHEFLERRKTAIKPINYVTVSRVS